MLATRISPAQARAALRALYLVAGASKGLHQAEVELLRAAAAALGTEKTPEILSPIEPEEMAALIPEEGGRRFLIQAMIMVALIDGEVDAAELAVIDRFAQALAVYGAAPQEPAPVRRRAPPAHEGRSGTTELYHAARNA